MQLKITCISALHVPESGLQQLPSRYGRYSPHVTSSRLLSMANRFHSASIDSDIVLLTPPFSVASSPFTASFSCMPACPRYLYRTLVSCVRGFLALAHYTYLPPSIVQRPYHPSTPLIARGESTGKPFVTTHLTQSSLLHHYVSLHEL